MEIYLDEVKKSDEFTNYFKVVNNIAAGSFGTVIQAIDEDDSEIAVKVIEKKQCNLNIQAIKNEITILQQLKHNNIVKFLGFLETDSHLYIKMEHIKGGTLKSFMSRGCNQLSENDIAIMVKHLLEAVNYLHSKDISHRDIKPENIMLQDIEDLTSIKLIDFGLSNQDNYDFSSDLCGTIIFMAPEQLEKRSFTKSVDIWSCGIVMYMLLNNGEHPVYQPGMSEKEYMSKMKGFSTKCVNKVSNMGMNLLKKLLEVDPGRRYTIDKCLQHPWITRRRYDCIPITYMESWKISLLKNKLRELFSGVIFILGYQKIIEGQNAKPKIPHSYINLLTKLSHELKLKFMFKRDKYFEASTSSNKDDSIDKSIINIVEEEEIVKVAIYKPDDSPNTRYSNLVKRNTIKKKLTIKVEQNLDQPDKILKKPFTIQASSAIKSYYLRKESLNNSPYNQKLQNMKLELSTLDSSPIKDFKKQNSLVKTRTQELFSTRPNLNSLKSVAPDR
jgi:serine/threonine protein kinase